MGRKVPVSKAHRVLQVGGMDQTAGRLAPAGARLLATAV
ncbi:hypothetical protein U724_25210 [Pseudomonas chlororaphis subsp. aurantiaca PB-St2]|nr:hypothetical protein U724_25210 [Pseudomonas chlororaphis subsp. aurantiaca PB-St2]